MTERAHQPVAHATAPSPHPALALIGKRIADVQVARNVVENHFRDVTIQTVVTFTFTDHTTHTCTDDDSDTFHRGTVFAIADCDGCDQTIYHARSADHPDGRWVTAGDDDTCRLPAQD